MATHSSILAWRIPWTEEPDGLQSVVSKRVRYNWVTKYTHTHTHTGVTRHKRCSSIPGLERSPGGRNGNPLQYSCLENPHGQRSLMGCSPWYQKESDTTEWLSTHTYTHTHTHTHTGVTRDVTRDVVRSLGWKDPLEKEMATCSSIHV